MIEINLNLRTNVEPSGAWERAGAFAEIDEFDFELYFELDELDQIQRIRSNSTNSTSSSTSNSTN